MTLAELIVAGRNDTAEYAEALEVADDRDLAAVLELTRHSSPDIRRDAVTTLPYLNDGEPTPAMITAAIVLTVDPVDRVRDFACFTLGQQMREVDTAELRDALAARLDDIDGETRREALLGLAYRRDPGALPKVIEALTRTSGELWIFELQAAAALSDPDLHDLVLSHRQGWDDPGADQIAELAVRLTDPAGLGDDVVHGVAELFRRKSRDLPLGDTVDWLQLSSELLDIAPHRSDEFSAAVRRQLWNDKAAQTLLDEYLAP